MAHPRRSFLTRLTPAGRQRATILTSSSGFVSFVSTVRQLDFRNFPWDGKKNTFTTKVLVSSGFPPDMGTAQKKTYKSTDSDRIHV